MRRLFSMVPYLIVIVLLAYAMVNLASRLSGVRSRMTVVQILAPSPSPSSCTSNGAGAGCPSLTPSRRRLSTRGFAAICYCATTPVATLRVTTVLSLEGSWLFL